PSVDRLSSWPPADAHLPWRPDSPARRRLREPLLDREGRRWGFHRGGRGARFLAGRAGRRRGGERPALRVGDVVVPAAGIAERGGRRPRQSTRTGPAARLDRDPAP